MFNGCLQKFLGTLQAILYKIKWTNFLGQIEPTLHIYKTFKDFKTSFLTDIAAANVCTMKKTRGLYHIPESRYFSFSPWRFSEIVAILTAPAVSISHRKMKEGGGHGLLFYAVFAVWL
jgi:hypothetical protein